MNLVQFSYHEAHWNRRLLEIIHESRAVLVPRKTLESEALGDHT
jgi:hypothetical protein